MTEEQLAVEVVFIVVIRGQVEFQNVKLIQITVEVSLQIGSESKIDAPSSERTWL
jgi:hypothetical protein